MHRDVSGYSEWGKMRMELERLARSRHGVRARRARIEVVLVLGVLALGGVAAFSLAWTNGTLP